MTAITTQTAQATVDALVQHRAIQYHLVALETQLKEARMFDHWATIEHAAAIDWMAAVDAICTLFDLERPSGVLWVGGWLADEMPWDVVNHDEHQRVLGSTSDCDYNWTWGITLEGETGRLVARELHGNGVPFDEYQGQTLVLWDAPKLTAVRTSRVNRMLRESQELRALCQPLLESYETRWNGNNHIGFWDTELFHKACDVAAEFAESQELACTPVTAAQIAYDCVRDDRSRVTLCYRQGSLETYAQEAVDMYDGPGNIVIADVDEVASDIETLLEAYASDEEE